MTPLQVRLEIGDLTEVDVAVIEGVGRVPDAALAGLYRRRVEVDRVAGVESKGRRMSVHLRRGRQIAQRLELGKVSPHSDAHQFRREQLDIG
jgi:hypothetical protein